MTNFNSNNLGVIQEYSEYGKIKRITIPGFSVLYELYEIEKGANDVCINASNRLKS